MKIEIPKPCSENFENFDKTAQGGFCRQCSTEVIDFTNKTDEEIFDFFLKAKGKVCGRLPAKDMSFKTVAPQLPKRGLAAASISLLSMAMSLNTGAQNNRVTTQGEVVASFIDEIPEVNYENSVSGRFLVKGSNLPVNGGKVTYGTQIVYSDANGVFLLPLPATVTSLERIEIYFDYEGKTSVRKTIHQPKGQMKLGDVHLETMEQKEIVVKGRLLDGVTKEPLIYAVVSTSDERIGTTTDFDGLFELRIPVNEVMECMDLEFSYIGYMSRIVEIGTGEMQQEIGDVFLDESVAVLGMIVGSVYVSRTARLKYKLKRFFGFGVKQY